jgi:hypothetical protein
MKIILTGATGYVGEGSHANNMREIALSQLVLARDGFEKFAVSPKDISSLAKKFENSI